MEVIILRGEIHLVTMVADILPNLKEIKRGKLFVTLPARKTVGRKKFRAKHSHKHSHI